ncbi:MAG: serine hydrolase domain-containing protein [Bacteroidota bacterium]
MNYLFSTFLLFFSTGLIGQNTMDSIFTQALEKGITKGMAEKNVPGLVIAILEEGELIYQQDFGWADVEKEVPTTAKTGFNIGSISKLFTAWGVMKLVQEGKLDLDAPVESYLTRWSLPPSDFDHNKVTIRALLSHTAGLSVHGYPGFSPELPLPSIEASLAGENGPVRDNEKVEVIIAPQTKFKYSGGGYTILQLLIEEVSQMSFAEYMHKAIFKPLGMRQTSFMIDKKILKNSAQPYDEEGELISMHRFAAQAAAGLHTNLTDLIEFAKACLSKNPILETETVQSMMTAPEAANGQYGLGFRILQLGPVTLKGHAGSNYGWQSGMMLHPPSKSGIIMLSNGSQGDDVLIATLRQWVTWKMSNNKF